MPGTVKQFVDFSNNTAADTGENTATSIQPILNGETLDQTVMQRPSEGLRQRTEAVKNVETDSLYLRDADRNLIIAGPGKITWPGSTTALASGIPVISDNLYILPMLTPGFAQTAPVPPVASAYGTLHLKRASDSMNSIVVTSQRRSYAAGDQISIAVTPGGVFSCVLDNENGYQRTVKIVATGATTLSTVITALTALAPTTIGDTALLLLAALEGGALGTDLLLTTQAKQYVSGNYDGEGHTITPANLASFFVSNPTQALGEGDTLCVNFPMVADTATTGGRRQATPENTNTAIPAGAYFNSRVHPENLVNALPICKVVNGSLVFSTGTEFAAGTASASLTADAGSHLIRNPGFEHGVTLNTGRYGITGWENRFDLAVNGNFRLNTTTPSSGAKQLEFNQTALGASTGRIEQQQEVAVNPGQAIHVAAMVRQLIAPTAGTYSVVLYWGDADSAASGSSSTAFQVLATVDAGYRSVSQTVLVPAGKRFLKTVTLEVAGVTLGSTGVSLLVDDLQIVVETQSGMTPAVDNVLLKPQTVDALLVEDPSTYALGQLATLLRMDKASPALEGKAILERKDQDYSGANLPPALALFGRLFQLGSKLLATEANSLKPRVSADFSAVAGVDFTLMWESGRNGETTGTYTQPAVRIYASNDGQMVMTSNAVWGGVTWTKDVAGQTATKQGLSKDGVRTYTRVSDVAWSDTAWADTFRLTNPLESTTDALTARVSTSGFDGVALTDVTLLFSTSFTGYVLRLYAAHLTDDVTFSLTTNARWNGTNWVKDTNGKVSTRMYVDSLLASPADSSRLNIYHQTCLTTDTFPNGDWIGTPTTTVLPSTGGTLFTGRVYAGPMSGSLSPQGRLVGAPEGFGDGLTAATFFTDTLYTIQSPNWAADPFGNPDSQNGMIFEEFWYNGLPPGWSAFTSGVGVVEANFNGVTRLRLNPGAVDSAGIRTDAFIHQAAYASFHAELLWPNVLGKTSFGYTDVAANQYIGFVQDSALYGDENFRVTLRTGAGLQVFNTGLSLTGNTNSWIKFRAFARGGSGLLTTTSLFWSIKSKKGGAQGVFTPGGAILNPTVGLYYRFDAQNGAFLVIERMAMGGHSNFAL